MLIAVVLVIGGIFLIVSNPILGLIPGLLLIIAGAVVGAVLRPIQAASRLLPACTAHVRTDAPMGHMPATTAIAGM